MDVVVATRAAGVELVSTYSSASSSSFALDKLLSLLFKVGPAGGLLSAIGEGLLLLFGGVSATPELLEEAAKLVKPVCD